MDKPPATGASSCSAFTCDIIGDKVLYSNSGDGRVDGKLLKARKPAVSVGTKARRIEITKELFILPMKPRRSCSERL
jgi:hypothetical protein